MKKEETERGLTIKRETFNKTKKDNICDKSKKEDDLSKRDRETFQK